MTERLDSRVAQPGDPDLDCHLTGLHLSSVIPADTGTYDLECLLIFDTTGAAGFWADAATGETASLARVTELTITFAVRMDAGYAAIAELMAARLQSWAETGVPLEMTAAPGKWTLLRSPTDVVPVPRGAGEDGGDAPQ